MSQAKHTDDEMELLKEHLPDSFLDDIDNLEAKIEESDLTDREYLAYVLSEESNLTGKESADLMEIEEGTFWGKMGRVRQKKASAESTIEITSI